jgi:uncharacterized membrane protein/uncharacterized protein YaaQ
MASNSDKQQWESDGQEETSSGPVWSFRGYRLRPGDFTTSMVHLYRGEINRASVWRQRLDSTTNWAVLITAAALSFAFGSEQTSHIVILLSTLMVTLFLFMEARRYRYYELWSYRIRLMETDFFAAMLVPPFGPSEDWSETLAENLLQPRFPISQMEALGRRLRRNYIPIYLILGITWVANLTLYPFQLDTWSQFFTRAAIGFLSGEIVLAAVSVFYAVLLVVGIFSRSLSRATGEVLPRYSNGESFTRSSLAAVDNQENRSKQAWFRPSRRRQELLSLIITDQPQNVADRVMEQMHRGVTGLDGTGMFTGKSHSVLMCALTVTEVPKLKSIVKKTDPKAMVIVTPAREIIGGGFAALNQD